MLDTPSGSHILLIWTRILSYSHSQTYSTVWHLDAHVNVRNINHHNDFELESLWEFCIRLAKRHLHQLADSYFNPLMVEACKYGLHPHPLLRHPRNVLLDPNDSITAANAQYIGRIHSSVSRYTPPPWRRGQSYLTARPRLGASKPNG